MGKESRGRGGEVEEKVEKGEERIVVVKGGG